MDLNYKATACSSGEVSAGQDSVLSYIPACSLQALGLTDSSSQRCSTLCARPYQNKSAFLTATHRI